MQLGIIESDPALEVRPGLIQRAEEDRAGPEDAMRDHLGRHIALFFCAPKHLIADFLSVQLSPDRVEHPLPIQHREKSWTLAEPLAKRAGACIGAARLRRRPTLRCH